MNLVYIGDKFYGESGSVMSPIYEVTKDGIFERSDWGFVQVALRNGEEIHIRQATAPEKMWAESVLSALKKRNK